MSTSAETGAARPDGVIHDIGYRGYQGPRLGRGYATRSLYTQSLRAAFGLGRSAKSKVLPMLVLAGIVLPAALMVAMAIQQQGTELPTDYPQYLNRIGLLMAEIFVAAQAPVLLSRDLRFSLVPLYFSRPITRGDYVRAKGAAMVTALSVVMALPLLVLYAGALLAGFDFAHNTGHLAIGLLAAVLQAVVLSAIGLLIAAATPRRGFGVAAIMAVLVVTSGVSTVLAGLHDGLDSASWSYLLAPSRAVQYFVNEVCGLVSSDRFSEIIGTPGTLGTVAFGLEIVALPAAAYVLLLRRYRKI
ncbi:ABC transporter permease [Kitasatospora nipponensis]|uniref:ABC transporter permease n=1 Tax=Kitasatospora nipponensis TaxID=258049 RepID=A0ABP4H6K3_9ACTN